MSKKIKTNRKRRVCRSTGCKHVLSIYNPENYCYVHQQIANGKHGSPISAAAGGR